MNRLGRAASDVAVAAVFGMAAGTLVNRYFKPTLQSPTAPMAPATPTTSLYDLVRSMISEISADRVLAVAAGVAFFGLMSLAPAITAFVSIYGLVVPPEQIADHINSMAGLIPPSAYSVVQDQIDKIAAKGSTVLGIASVFGLLVALWSANGAMKALIDALNVAYGVKDRRGIIAFNAVSLAMTAGAVIVLVGLLVTMAAVPLILEHLWLGWAGELLLDYGRWPVLFILVVSAIAVLYRFGPDVPGSRWRWITPGGLLAAFGILVFSLAFSWYATNLGNFEATYGSLSAVIAFMIWGWLTSVIVLSGAELNAELDRRSGVFRPGTSADGTLPR